MHVGGHNGEESPYEGGASYERGPPNGGGMEDHHMEEEHHGIHMKDHSMDIHTGMEVNGGGASDVGALMISFSGRRSDNGSIFVGRSIYGRSWGYEE